MAVFQWIASVVLIVLGLFRLIYFHAYIQGVFAVVMGIALLPPLFNKISGERKLLRSVPIILFSIALVVALIGGDDEGRSNLTDQLDYDKKMARYKAERAIKSELKDPESFEVIDHTSRYEGSADVYVSCTMQFRAKNSFGGYGVETWRVDFDRDLNAIATEKIE